MGRVFTRSMRTVFCILALLGAGTACAQQQGWYTEGDFAPVIRISVVLTNSLDIERRECPVIIPRSLMPFVSFYEESVFVVDPLLPSQPDPSYEQAKAVGMDEVFFVIGWNNNCQAYLFHEYTLSARCIICQALHKFCLSRQRTKLSNGGLWDRHFFAGLSFAEYIKIISLHFSLLKAIYINRCKNYCFSISF